MISGPWCVNLMKRSTHLQLGNKDAYTYHGRILLPTFPEYKTQQMVPVLGAGSFRNCFWTKMRRFFFLPLKPERKHHAHKKHHLCGLIRATIALFPFHFYRPICADFYSVKSNLVLEVFSAFYFIIYPLCKAPWFFHQSLTSGCDEDCVLIVSI